MLELVNVATLTTITGTVAFATGVHEYAGLNLHALTICPKSPKSDRKHDIE